MWGLAIDVPDAVSFSPGGQGPITVPVVSHEDEIETPGAEMSGQVRPVRSPRATV
jgi:hypothetical protein